MADGIGLDLGDLGFRIAQRAQGRGHGAVDDLEIAAAGELLELHQREVGLDAGGVAIHDEADGAGRGDDRDLGVAVAVLLAELEGIVPGELGALGEGLSVSEAWSSGTGAIDELLVAGRHCHGRRCGDCG